MLRSMFGMGGSEILVILIVALLFLGPDKLPEAAKSISKGIRDIKKQSRVLQRTIEDDEHIGGAIRDLKSALRGEDEPVRPRPPKPAKQLVETVAAVVALPEPGTAEPGTAEHGAGPDEPAVSHSILGEPHGHAGDAGDAAGTEASAADAKPALTMPPVAGEPDAGPASAASDHDDLADLAAMVKPAADTIPRTVPSAAEPPDPSEPKHG